MRHPTTPGSRIRGLFCIAALVAGCATPQDTIREPTARIEAPLLRSGERWIYDRINPFNRTVVSALTEDAASEPIAHIPFPLAPGMQWSEQIVVPEAFGPPRVQRISGRALGWERVRTPAGEFLALKVQREMGLGDADHQWTQTHRSDVIWYAPEVRRWVRIERRDERYARSGRNGRHVEHDWIIWQLKEFVPG